MALSEIWKDISGYEGIYQVSNLGRVRSIDRIDNLGRHKREKILTPCVGHNGYYFVRLYGNGKYSNRRINRLVAEAFIPTNDYSLEVNHKNGVKTDNSIENLEWCTRSENTLHAFATGLKQPMRGEKHGSSKLTKAEVDWIRDNYTPRDKKYGCHAMAKVLGVSPSQVCGVAKYVFWKDDFNEHGTVV